LLYWKIACHSNWMSSTSDRLTINQCVICFWVVRLFGYHIKNTPMPASLATGQAKGLPIKNPKKEHREVKISIKKFLNGKQTLFQVNVFQKNGQLELDTECINEFSGEIFPTSEFPEFKAELQKQELLLTLSQRESIPEPFVLY